MSFTLDNADIDSTKLFRVRGKRSGDPNLPVWPCLFAYSYIIAYYIIAYIIAYYISTRHYSYIIAYIIACYMGRILTFYKKLRR